MSPVHGFPGDPETIMEIKCVCEALFCRAFPIEEAEQHLMSLPLIRAIQIWQGLGPDLVEMLLECPLRADIRPEA